MRARLCRRQGHGTPPVKKKDYALRACVKRFTGPPHPERDRQFAYIAKQRAAFRQTGAPIISADTKKKELIGNFANAGRTWGRQPHEVNAHDFPQDARARAVPYGLYDVQRRQGHVCLGVSGDTPRFSVSAIRDWWRTKGRQAYRGRTALLLLCDAGGSNSCRSRAWKYEVQRQLADECGLTVTVCHYPTGASKWNPVEHRLFGPISVNWAGEPLCSLGKMLNLIRGTKTTPTTATLDRHSYKPGQKITAAEWANLKLKRHTVCPQWNYTIAPQTAGAALRAGP